MPYYTLYNDNSHPAEHLRGAIVSLFEGSLSSATVCLRPNQSLIEGKAKLNDQWVDPATQTLKEKTQLALVLDKSTIIADGTDTAVLSGLPVPCVVLIDGAEYTVDDGTLEITSDTPGRIIVHVQLPQYIHEEWVIYAL